MERFWSILLPICFIGYTIQQNSTTQFMNLERDITLENLWATSGHMGEQDAHSSVECANQCLGNSGCQSFFYSVRNKLCQMHSTVIESVTGLVPATDDSRYYLVRTNVSKEEVLQQSIPCPLTTMISPDVILLSDQTYYKYGIIKSMYTSSTGNTACNQLGATLTHLTTQAKLSALQYIFNNCTGYVGSGEYWVGVSNVNANDFSNISQWTTPDGQPIPETFWAPQQPKSPDVNHCAALTVNTGYLLSAYSCGSYHNIICEDVTYTG